MNVMEMTVLQAKRYGVFTCRATDALGAAAVSMFRRDVSGLVVVDEAGLLEGIVTRTDLLRAAALEAEWAEQPVGSAMTVDVVTVGVQEELGVVLELLLQEHIHRVVAVEREGERLRPVALLSSADLVYHLAQEVLARPGSGATT